MRRLALLCVAFLVAISGCATTSRKPTRSAAQLQDLGEKCMAAGETARALEYLTQAGELKHNDAVIEYDLALAYDQRGLKDKALLHLQNALKIRPVYPEALNTMGYIYATNGQFELARGAFEKAIADPFYKTPQFAVYNLGRLYERNGDIERALSYYQQAVKLDQRYGIAWLRIGQIQEQLHRTDEARHAYGNAVRESPDLAEAHLRFGILSYSTGDLQAALRSLSRVREIAPNTDMADEARKYLVKINPSAPDAGVKFEPVQAHPMIQGQTGTPAVRGAPAPAEGGAPAQRGVSKEPESKSCRYSVQVGPFLEREKAEEMKTRLEQKGYSGVVKAIKHKDLGEVFVIQLQPVNTTSSATTLKTQLSGEIEGEPEIVKVPPR